MTQTMRVSIEDRDERILDNLDLVELEAAAQVAQSVRSGHIEWNEYRDDMESAGRLALVEGAATFVGGGFRPWVRIVIRNAMRDEIRKLANLTRTRDDDGSRTWKERDMSSNVDFLDVPTSRDTEDNILRRIDSRRAFDLEWADRERRWKGDPVMVWRAIQRYTTRHAENLFAGEPNILCACNPRRNCAHVRVYRARYEQACGLAETARVAGVNPFHVPRLERDALALLIPHTY